MDKALKIEGGIESMVSAESIKDEYHGNIPRRVSFICPFCRQPLNACAMKPWNVNAPHFKHEKNNEIAHECEMYASNSTYSNIYHRVPMAVYLRRSSKSGSIFVMELGFRQLDAYSVAKLESEHAVIEIGRRRYDVTFERFGHGAIRLPIDSPSLRISGLVRLAHSHSNLFITWGRPEDSKVAMVFSADLDTLCGKRINYCSSIQYGSPLMIVVPASGEIRLRKALSNAKRLGTVQSSPGGAKLAVYSAVAPLYAGSDNDARLYLQECGYSLEEGNEIPTIIWPPAMEISNEFEPLFRSRKLVFASPKNVSPGSVFLHKPFDTDEETLRMPFISAKGGDGSFALVKSESQMRFASSKNSVASVAAILWSGGDLTGKILDDPAFLVDCERDGNEVTIQTPSPCRITKAERRKLSTSVLDLKAHEEIKLEIDSGDHVAVSRPLRASSGFIQVLSCDAEQPQAKPGAARDDKPRSLLARTHYPSGKITALMRKDATINSKQKTLKLARIRKGER